jgi:hypothetical protein
MFANRLTSITFVSVSHLVHFIISLHVTRTILFIILRSISIHEVVFSVFRSSLRFHRGSHQNPRGSASIQHVLFYTFTASPIRRIFYTFYCTVFRITRKSLILNFHSLRDTHCHTVPRLRQTITRRRHTKTRTRKKTNIIIFPFW